ncbi:MAG: putative colanic acid biosynthesis acetyltransferase [Verrucomicrobia bacterium]|nr:putative colanic acid biosynthesis acetyltransferase [Verrucomicrobiota bacterium]
MPAPLHTFTHQQSATDSPWTTRERLGLLLWHFVWPLLCAWTPKPLNAWRLLVLRAFGARLHGQPQVHPRARIQIPWNLTLHDRATLGDRANAYSLGPIEIGPRATVAQEAYLCAGTHDFDDPRLPLQTAPIRVEADAFIFARVFVMPGITIGARAIVGAGSVVTKDVPPDAIAVGNPCRVLRSRGEVK